MTRLHQLRISLITAALLLLVAGEGALAAQSAAPPPDGDWLTLESDHFRITYEASLEALVEGLALRSEVAWAFLEERFVESPGGRIDIVLTDHIDDSNGFTSVTPRGRIVLFARPPVDDFALMHYSDWLGLLVLHELTHTFQLERHGPLGSLTRLLLGRFPETWPSFPERALPGWTLEGIATWYESAGTGGGRVFGSALPMMLRSAALEDAFEGVGEASGQSDLWPAGTRPYAYGAFFIDYLVQRFGEPALGDWVRAVEGQWIPFRIDAAARRAFGIGISDAWSDWEAQVRDDAFALRAAMLVSQPLSRTDTVVSGGRWHGSPRVSPDGATLAYGRADGRSDVQLRRVELNGEGSVEWTRVNRLGSFDWTPEGGLIFAQPDFTDRYRVRSDLYEISSAGQLSQLSEGLRLDQPDLAPDGRSGVAVQYLPVGVDLVAFDRDSMAVTALEMAPPGSYWAHPRISPNGEWIAVTQWAPGAYPDLVILGRNGREVVRITDDPFDDFTPAWSPDGSWLLWVSDRTGIPNVHAVSVSDSGGPGAAEITVGPVLQVTHVTGGVADPSVGPDGRWLYFSSYHATGWQIERMPFDSGTWFPPLPHLSTILPARVVSGLAPSDPSGAGDPPTPAGTPFLGGVPTGVPIAAGDSIPRPMARGRYRSLRYLLPTYLEPVLDFGMERAGTQLIGTSFGLRTRGSDLIGRYMYDAEARFEPEAERWSGRFLWSWLAAGNPTFSVFGAQRWGSGGPFQVRTADNVIGPFFFLERERQVGASVGFVSRNWRRSTSVSVSGSLVQERRIFYDEELEEVDLRLDALPSSSRLVEGATSVSFSTARAHGQSITLEAGASGFVRARVRRDLRANDSPSETGEFDRSFEDVIAGLRLYQGLRVGGIANHVLALRVSGGYGAGNGADAFHFDLGGAEGQAETVTGLGLFGGRRLLFPLRGLERGRKSGSRVWSASAEYRVPLIRANSGLGTFPLHFDDVYLAAFADAGDAWGPDDGMFSNPAGDPVVSLGAELAVEVLPFWTIPLVVRGGVAVPIAGVPEHRALFHFRLGVSF